MVSQMQRMQRMQQRMGDRARWFRLGMVSATAMTPLITRWRSLRAAERARALWEASQAHGPLPWSPARRAETPPAEAPRANVRPGLWLAGAGVGLVAAGAVAFVVARRRMLAAEERPLDLPLSGLNGTDRPGGESRDPVRAGVTTATATTGPAGAEQTAAAPSAWDVRTADSLESLPDEVAPIIGNLRTLDYYDASSPNVPEETDRVYFRSAEDARAAGFHAAR
ncbi:MAG TPA: hypothetical protein VGR57_17170 [Ktedonobacterales bacterium]|nr:hypothetical protein [Ktedonobacterales bacterium]